MLYHWHSNGIAQLTIPGVVSRCRNTLQCTEGAQVFYDFVNKVSADMYPLLWQPRYELSRIPLLDQRDAETSKLYKTI